MPMKGAFTLGSKVKIGSTMIGAPLFLLIETILKKFLMTIHH